MTVVEELHLAHGQLPEPCFPILSCCLTYAERDAMV